MKERLGGMRRGKEKGRGGEEGNVCCLFVMCTISLELFSKCHMVF